MPHLDVKINKFTSSIIESAANDSKDALSQIEKDRYNSIAAKENDFLGAAYKKIKDDVAKVRAECGREISRKVLDSKKTVFQRRREIETEVLDRLRERLESYTETAEYREYLMSTARRFAEYVGNAICVLYLREKDMSLANELSALFPGGVSCEVGSTLLGGLILVSDESHIRIDETYDSVYAEIGGAFAEIFQKAAGPSA